MRRKHAAALAAVVALGGVGTQVAEAAPAVHQHAAVYQFEDMADVGDASLTRNTSGVTMNIDTAISGGLFDFGTPVGPDWSAGDATTVWFVVFNDPSECVGGCGEDEVIDAATGGDNLAKVGVHYGTGHVADGDDFEAGARLKEGDMSGALFGVGLMDAMAAEIHLVVRSHGPAAALTGQELASALHSVGGGCAVDGLGPNDCGDSQFAVFLAP